MLTLLLVGREQPDAAPWCGGNFDAHSRRVLTFRVLNACARTVLIAAQTNKDASWTGAVATLVCWALARLASVTQPDLRPCASSAFRLCANVVGTLRVVEQSCAAGPRLLQQCAALLPLRRIAGFASAFGAASLAARPHELDEICLLLSILQAHIKAAAQKPPAAAAPPAPR